MFNYRDLRLTEFGLDDPDVLEVATQLAPELFAALVISYRQSTSNFPITSDAELERALLAAATDDDRFDTPGVVITPADCHDRFPADFLPVEDKLDLLRKVYMAIVIAHTAEANERLSAAQRGDIDIASSHPLDLGALR